MVSTKTVLRFVILVSISFIALGACTKRQASSAAQAHQTTNQTTGAGKTSAGKSPAPSPAGAPPGAGTVRLKPVNPGTAGASPSAQASRTSSIAASIRLEGTDRLLAMQGGSPVYPLDYEIGQLQPNSPAGTMQGQIVRTIRRFFDSLAAGKPDDSLLSPTWRDDIIRSLRNPIEKGDVPASVRIGVLRVEQAKAHAALRLEKGNASATGEIYLERSDDTWYISDIQVDFSQLGHPFKRTTQFDPAEWKAMLKE